MTPIGKNIVIKTIEEEIVTSSGLMLSSDDANKQRYKRGLIIKPGVEVRAIEEGQEIYYDKRAGYTMFIENEAYTIIQENDVVVVL
jgi:co-chaperonin GroES (HSP10)